MALVAATQWARRQDDALRAAQARADTAELGLAQAQASLTAIASAQAADATATADAIANSPSSAVQRALRLVFTAYQDPTDQRLAAMSDALGPNALPVFQQEFDHLQQLVGSPGTELEFAL